MLRHGTGKILQITQDAYTKKTCAGAMYIYLSISFREPAAFLSFLKESKIKEE